jgi:hypothetical protein
MLPEGECGRSRKNVEPNLQSGDHVESLAVWQAGPEASDTS